MAWCALSDAQRYKKNNESTRQTSEPHKQAPRHHHLCNSVSRTCETRIVKGLFMFHANIAQHRHFFANKAGFSLHDVTTSVSPQHHVVVSNLTPGIWNSHDGNSGSTAWATRESTRKRGQRAPDSATCGLVHRDPGQTRDSTRK